MSEWKRFRKKPVEVDAWQWDGTSTASERPEWLRASNVTADHSEGVLSIETSEGMMVAAQGDWLIQGKDEIFLVPPDVFEMVYEPVE